MEKNSSRTTTKTIAAKSALKAVIDQPLDPGRTLPGLPLEVSGWGFFGKKPAALVELCLDGGPLHIQSLNRVRPDVRRAYPQVEEPARPLGFYCELDLTGRVSPGKHALEVFFYDDDHRRARAAKVDIYVHERADSTTFLERFDAVPSDLMIQVNATVNDITFTQAGEETRLAIEQALGRRRLREANRILDFGCGLGRVLAPMLAAYPQAEFTGFDVDRRMIQWLKFLNYDLPCRLTLSSAELPSGIFDVIYIISVFTHLDQYKDYWFSEVNRLLAPGGRAFITYHDETLLQELIKLGELKEAEEALKFKDYYIFGKGSPEGSSGMGTFYSTPHWEKTLRRYFHVEKTVPRGLFGKQSYSVVRKRRFHADPVPALRAYVRALERSLIETARHI